MNCRHAAEVSAGHVRELLDLKVFVFVFGYVTQISSMTVAFIKLLLVVVEVGRKQTPQTLFQWNSLARLIIEKKQKKLLYI